MTPTSHADGIDLAFTALLAQRLAVIAGAGLSMAAPSRLPSAWKLAERAKTAYALQWGAAKPALSDDIEAQAEFFFAQNELQTVYLATLIDRHAFAGRPNPGHLAVADLMLSQAIQTVVTTNVDVLVETAGNELFGQIEAGIDGKAVAALPPGAVPMLKIHGCRHVDWLNTVWARSQLTIQPVLGRVASSIPWVSQRLLNRDLLIVGYWTDWDYLNQILTQVMNAITPSRVIVVDPADAATFPVKAPALFDLGQRAASGFHHVTSSGADFLAALRRKFSDHIVRAVLHSGSAAYEDDKGVAPDPTWLEPPAMDDTQSWLLRRDLLGCAPNAPATSRTPPHEPLLGMTLLRLLAAGATSDGSSWKLGGKAIRVLRTPNQILHRVEAEYDGDIAPIVAPDFVIAVGAESRALPTSIARGGGPPSIARASGGSWLSYSDAVKEFGL
jgi:SIR2-like domain